MSSERGGINPTSVYGFVSWIVSFVLIVAYVVWEFVPDDLLYSWGITYYPWKYWGVALFLMAPVVSPAYPFLIMSVALKNNPKIESRQFVDDSLGEIMVPGVKLATGDLDPKIVRSIRKRLIINHLKQKYG
ncbi:PIG-P protein [Gregarina niphandrodes]|uniref:PIG-P protein n=1 Tax=Gregarina niphandrodes TaxID=110365 RepID=A0A023AYR7_GRENI|nr:PIG-P protein [Gregarina niphandrodes]EZG43415.1 PIG-P protein [Gregarina niphandrodes]|eukprot:XP_011133356.1 PIG-P protein [Gregarina niphandrodes]